MQKDISHFHHIILTKLHSHLRKQYPYSYNETIQQEHIDSLLAFKSDSHLEQLRAALDRLDEGTFGVCLSCKQEIDIGPLHADPTCRMCERCEIAYSGRASKYEGAILSI
jgi:RNA polymerase-binding transcription factor DksA